MDASVKSKAAEKYSYVLVKGGGNLLKADELKCVCENNIRQISTYNCHPHLAPSREWGAEREEKMHKC